MITTESEPFRIVQEYITGNIKVMENTQFNHIDADIVEVASRVKARLFGNVKVLILHEASKVFLHGKCGEVINHGGRPYIYNP